MKNLLKNIYRNIIPKPYRPKPLMYRVMLFNELLEFSKDNYFKNKRILEIGPKDGLDSNRLASLHPKELIMIDLPEKRKGNEKWLNKISCNSKYIEENFMYMSQNLFQSLGKFHLIYCTGVLYHNAEQLRLLRKLYRLLEIGGYLVLESATLRNAKSLKNGSFVQIHYPETYNNTGTITHLPTANAIKAWLNIVGFKEINDSQCYKKYNKKSIGQRYACICKKNNEDEADVYYNKSRLNPPYLFGDSR